ncbi:MAG: phage integrase family protein [Paludibacteraceae bacterium]|nr:phage integrase family protein [Paludibacteraceae bacterium]
MKHAVVLNYQEEVLTIVGAFDAFYEDKKAHGLAKDSLVDYEYTFHYMMNHFGFDEYTPLTELTTELFKKWTIEMMEDGKRHSTINRYLRDCKVFLNWCIENALFFGQIKIEMVKGQEELVKAFPPEDIILVTRKPTNKCDFIEWRTWAVTNWVLATGNRAGTIVNLHINDVDFKTKEIRLRHTKNKKAQVIPLSNALTTILREYMRMWRYNSTAEDYLFPNIGNEQLTSDALQQSFAKYCKKRGSSHTNIHGLRHTFALNWIRNGGNEFKLQKMLGHSTLEMTRRYVHLATEDLKEDFESFSTLDTLHKPKKPVCKVFNNMGRYN